MIDGSAAPPARQADTDRLPGIRGHHHNTDLPLTAFVRRLAGPIELATIVTALVALLLVFGPLLLSAAGVAGPAAHSGR